MAAQCPLGDWYLLSKPRSADRGGRVAPPAADPSQSNRARQKARQPASPRPRTRSSNPVPSSRESTNFRFLGHRRAPPAWFLPEELCRFDTNVLQRLWSDRRGVGDQHGVEKQKVVDRPRDWADLIKLVIGERHDAGVGIAAKARPQSCEPAIRRWNSDRAERILADRERRHAATAAAEPPLLPPGTRDGS